MSIQAELGAMLREAREAKQMPVEELAAESGLPARYVTSLEEGRFDDLPDQAYARMYLLNCARTLGMNVEELKLRWPKSHTQTVAPLQASQGLQIPWKPIGAGLVIVVLIWLGLGWTNRDSASTGGISPAGQSPETDHTPGNAKEAATVAGIDPSATSQAPMPDPIHKLVLKATEQSWVVIEADGDTIEARVVAAGRMLEATAKEDFVITVGRPQAVQATLDGQRVDLPSQDGTPLVRHRLDPRREEKP